MEVPEGLHGHIEIARKFTSDKERRGRLVGDYHCCSLYFRPQPIKSRVSFYRLSGADNLFEVSAMGLDHVIERISGCINPNDSHKIGVFLAYMQSQHGL